MTLNFEKSIDGLLPAVIQDAQSLKVLMLGYMSAESLELTRQSGRVTFYSRSRKSLWLKGETSGNFLNVVKIHEDCDHDAILILARPEGPTCHQGTQSCFAEVEGSVGGIGFLEELEGVVESRIRERPQSSYVTQLLDKGLDRIAQKVGEEAVETIIAAKNPELAPLESEAADLLFHLMVLLKVRGSSLARLARVLEQRHR